METATKDAANGDYSSQGFWEQRYANEPKGGVCEWYFSLETLLPLMRSANLLSEEDEDEKMKRTIDVLEIGCGDAPLLPALPLGMARGRRVAIDFSAHVIEKLLKEAPSSSSSSSCEFLVEDARRMRSFAAHSFDLLIDKGTLDAMLCDPRLGARNVRQIFQQVTRIMRPTGAFLIVSHLSFASEEFQDMLQSVVMPVLIEEDRSSQWSLEVFQTEEDDEEEEGDDSENEEEEEKKAQRAATVYLYRRRPRRFTRHMLLTPAALTTVIRTFEQS